MICCMKQKQRTQKQTWHHPYQSNNLLATLRVTLINGLHYNSKTKILKRRMEGTPISHNKHSSLNRVHVLAHKSFQLAPKTLLISKIVYSPSVIWISPKNSTCPSGKLTTKIPSPIAKSTSPGLSDMTFFARCSRFYLTVSRLQFV